MMKISEMPKYDDYVDSGVEWLGRVPASWELTRLGTRFNERRSKVSDIDYPALSVTKKGVLPQLDNAAKTKDGDNRKLVKEGDFVINSRSDRKGSSGVSDRDGSVSLINIVLKPKGIHPKFSEHLLKSHAFIEEYYRVGRGIVADLWTTRYDEMRTITISVPSLEEQTRIANFLDKKTALIDEAISIKEKQINLLKERKQIIIQQAVTQGLDPNVPMKDSGVDWIGKIPEHWEVKRIKHVGKIINGYAFPSDAFIQEGARVMKISNIQTMRLDWSDSSYVDALWLDKTAQFRIYKGDLVFALTRPVISTGIKAALVDTDEPILLNQRNAVFRPNDTCDKNWIYFVLLTKGFINDFEMQIDITGQQPNISTVAIGNLPFPLPPELEQKVIVSDLSRRCALLDMAVDDQIAQIERLKEYKTTLINSAVTGKIKITPEMVEQ